jgi:hypothetical protein
MKTNLPLVSVLATALSFAAASSYGDTIADLFNTGVDASGTPMSSGVDPHYMVVSGPGGAATALVGNLTPGYWIGNDTLSQWTYSSASDYDPGYFDFQTTFSLGLGSSSTASISGQFATDNSLVNAFLNGKSLGISQLSDFYFTEWHPFSIGSGSGFIDGLNTLDFVIFNDQGPSGLRVEMTGDTGTQSVPDTASTVAMLGSAFLGLAALRRRFVA